MWRNGLITDFDRYILYFSELSMCCNDQKSSFKLKKTSFIHTHISATQAFIQDITSYLDVASDCLNAIWSWVWSARGGMLTHDLGWFYKEELCILWKVLTQGESLEEHQTTYSALERKYILSVQVKHRLTDMVTPFQRIPVYATICIKCSYTFFVINSVKCSPFLSRVSEIPFWVPWETLHMTRMYSLSRSNFLCSRFISRVQMYTIGHPIEQL